MTAETIVGPRAQDKFPVYDGRHLGAGAVQAAWGYHSQTAAIEDGDIWELCKVPAGARIVGGFFICSDGDTGAEALEIDVGWKANGGSGTYDSASVSGLVNSGVLTGDGGEGMQAGYNLRHFAVMPGAVYFTKETTIQAEGIAISATHQDFSLGVCVQYVVDPTVAA